MSPCSAYEIYCGICDVISIARQQETNARGLLLLEEKVAACVSKRWHELDMPGEIKYYNNDKGRNPCLFV
ncbi:MAG: hypothetical protein ACLURP_01980 [Ruminococcus sp.]